MTAAAAAVAAVADERRRLIIASNRQILSYSFTRSPDQPLKLS